MTQNIKKSRSFSLHFQLQRQSIQKLKKKMENQQRAYLQLKQANSIFIQKQQSGTHHHNFKLPKIQIKRSKSTPNFKHKSDEKSENLTLVFQAKKPLRLQIPNEGYRYIDMNNLQNGVSESIKIRPVIQKTGLVLEYDGRQEENQVYNIQKFDRVLRICNKMKDIMFFKDFYRMKLFKVWKFYITNQRLRKIQKAIIPSLHKIYSQRWLQIKELICEIIVKHFLQPPQGISIIISKYRQYLQTASSKCLTNLEEIFKLIAKKSFEVLDEDISKQLMLSKLKQRVVYKVYEEKLKQKIQVGKRRSSLKTQTNSLKIDRGESKFMIFFRKVIYSLNQISLSLYIQFLGEVKQTLSKVHIRYKDKKKLYIKYMMTLENKFKNSGEEIEGQEKTEKNFDDKWKKLVHEVFEGHQMGQIELIRISFNSQLFQGQYRQQLAKQVVTIFLDYIEYVKNVLQQQSLLKLNGIRDQEQLVIAEVSHQIDQYKLQNLIKGFSDYEQFRVWVSAYAIEAVKEVDQIFIYIKRIIEDINDFVSHNQTMLSNSKIRSPDNNKIRMRRKALTFVEGEKNNSEKLDSMKVGLVNFFQRKSENMGKLQRLPNYINLGIFSISLIETKQEICMRIDQIQNGIKKYVPQNFDKIAHEISGKLHEIDQKISIYSWNIEEFVSSCKGQSEFEQLNSSGKIFNYTETLNKFLSVLSKVSDLLYKQKSIKNLQIKQELKRISQKVHEFQSRKQQRLKDLRPKVDNLKEEIWQQLSRIQGQINEKMNSQLQNITDMLSYFPIFQNKLAGIKRKIDNLLFMQTVIVEHCLPCEKTFKFASYAKLENDCNLLKQFIQNYIQIKKQVAITMEEPLSSNMVNPIIEDISEAINESRINQQSLIPYSHLINKIQNQYYDYQKFFQTANQISYLEHHQLQQIQNKKYFDFSRKKQYLIKDLYLYRLHEKQNQLSEIFLKKYYKRVLSDLIVEFEDFTERSVLNIDIEIIKYQKLSEPKNFSRTQIVSNSFSSITRTLGQSVLTDQILQNSNEQSSSQFTKGLNNFSFCKARRKSNIEATCSQKIQVFVALSQNKCILTDLQMQFDQLRTTCDSLSQQSFKDETTHLTNSLKMLIHLFTEISQCQEKYLGLLKNGCLKGSSFFEDISKLLDEAKQNWERNVISQLGGKPISLILKNNRQYRKSIQSFGKQVAHINKKIDSKIQDRRRQVGLLYLCSNATVLKIIQNPLHFIHQFYSSVDEICLDPDRNCLVIETHYKEQLKISFKSKSIQLSKLRQQIAKYVKLQCFLTIYDEENKKPGQMKTNENILDENNIHSQKKPFQQYKPIASVNKNNRFQLIQVSYLKYCIDLQQAFKGKQFEQINNILNKQIEFLTTKYETINSQPLFSVVKIDLFISLCIQLRARINKGQQQFFRNCLVYELEVKQKPIEPRQSRLIHTILKKSIFEKNRQNQKKKLEIVRNQIKNNNAQNMTNSQTSFVISREKINRRRSSLTLKKSFFQNLQYEIIKQTDHLDSQEDKSSLQSKKQQKQFNSFKVKLKTFNQMIELSYDLIDPKYLTHFVSTEKMLLSIFNAFNNPLSPVIVEDEQGIQSISYRLFRLYKKMNWLIKRQSSNIFANIVRLAKITIIIHTQESKQISIQQVCLCLSKNSMKYAKQCQFGNEIDIDKKSKIFGFEHSKEIMSSPVIEKFPSFFLLCKNNRYSCEVKAERQKFRVISLQSPCISQLLQIYSLGLKSRYSSRIIMIIVEFIKDLSFFLFQIRNEKLNIQDSKALVLHILQEMEISLSKQFKDTFRQSFQPNISQKLKLILTTPLTILGLKSEQISLIMSKYYCQLSKYIEAFQEQNKQEQKQETSNQDKDNVKNWKVVKCEIMFALNPANIKKFGFQNKILTLVGPPCTGKSFCLKQCISQLSESSHIHFVNSSIYLYFTQFFTSIQTMQQLRLKLIQFQKSKEMKIKKQSKLIQQYIVFEGFDCLKFENITSLLQNLSQTDLYQEIETNRLKYLFEIKQMSQLTPKTIVNLQMINFSNIQTSFQSYIFELEQVLAVIYESGLQNNEFIDLKATSIMQFSRISQISQKNSHNTLHGNKTMIQKSFLNFILNKIPLILRALKTQPKLTVKNLPKIQICVDQKQFYNMFNEFFKALIKMNDKKLKSLINQKSVYSVSTVKKIIAFCIYWTLYYTLDDEKARSKLFEILIQIKQFAQLYFCQNNEMLVTSCIQNSLQSIANFISDIHTPNSSLSIQQHTLENKTIQFGDQGVYFQRVNHSDSEQKQSSLYIDQYLFVQTKQIKMLRQFCGILLNRSSENKAIILVGEKITGKTKFIYNLMDYCENFGNSSQTICSNQERQVELQIKAHYFSHKQIKSEVDTKNSGSNQQQSQVIVKLKQFKRKLYKMHMSSNGFGVSIKNIGASEDIKALIYVDDLSMNCQQSIKQSLVHQFIKNLCLQSSFLFNEQLIYFNDFSLFYESKTSSNRQKTMKLLKKVWYLYPIYFAVSNNYLPSIFEIMISRCMYSGLSRTKSESVFSYSSQVEHKKQSNLKCGKQQSQIKNFISILKQIIQNSEGSSKAGQTSISWAGDRRQRDKRLWVYGVSYSNVYKTLYQFLKKNQFHQFIGSQTHKFDSDKVFQTKNKVSDFVLQNKDGKQQKETEKKFDSIFEELTTAIIFNMTARLKCDHRDFNHSPIFCSDKKKLNNHVNKSQTNIFNRYRQFSDYHSKDASDLIAEKILEKRSLKKTIIFNQLRQNISKLSYAIKTSHFILANRTLMLDGINFLEIACEIIGVRIHRIQGIVNDFDAVLSRLSKFDKNGNIIVYISLETIYNSPKILECLAKHIKSFFTLKKSHQEKASFHYTSKSSAPSSIKQFLSEKQHLQNVFNLKSMKKYQNHIQMNNNSINFLIQYPPNLDHISVLFLENDVLLKNSTIIWFDEVNVNSHFSTFPYQLKEQQPKLPAYKSPQMDERMYLQLLRNGNYVKSNIIVQYLVQFYPKKGKEEISALVKYMQRVYETIEKQSKAFINQKIYKRTFNFSNYLIFCRSVIDIYSRAQTENVHKIKTIQSVLSSLQFLFREFEAFRANHLYENRNKKQVQENIRKIIYSIEIKKKFIDEYTRSGQKEEQIMLELKCKQNQQKIHSLNTKTQSYRTQALKAHSLINRTEIAELKYLFNSSYETFYYVFTIIAIILGEEIIICPPPNFKGSPMEKQTLRKCITDVNIMLKIKQQSLLQMKNPEIVKLIHSKLSQINDKEKQKQKSSFMKNMLAWIRYSIKYKISIGQKKKIIEQLNQQRQNAKQRITEIYEKYKVEQLSNQVTCLEKQLEEKRLKLKNITSYIEKESIKLAKFSDLILKLSEFEKICKSKLDDINNKMKSLLINSLKASIQCSLTAFMPYCLRAQLRLKYEKLMEKILQQEKGKCNEKKNKNLIFQDLRILNKLKQNDNFKISNTNSHLMTKERELILSIILRQFCLSRQLYKKLMIVDPSQIFIRDISMFTTLSYLVLELDQLNQPYLPKILDSISLVIIKTPPGEWTVQYIKNEHKDEYVLEIYNLRVKWNKSEIKLKKDQNCIFLTTSIENSNQLTDLGYSLLYYDLQNGKEWQQIVQRILRSFQFENSLLFLKKLISSKNQGFEKDHPLELIYQKLIKQSDEIMYSIINQISVELVNSGLNSINCMSEIINRVDTFGDIVRKYRVIQAFFQIVNNSDGFDPFISYNHYLNERYRNSSAETYENIDSTKNMKEVKEDGEEQMHCKLGKNIGKFKILSKMISVGYETMKRILDQKLSNEGTKQEVIKKQLQSLKSTYSTSNNKVKEIYSSVYKKTQDQEQDRRSIKCCGGLDFNILKSGIQSAFYLVKSIFSCFKKMQNFNVSNTPNGDNIFACNMVKYTFNFLLLGFEKKYQFFYLVQLRLKQIFEDNDEKFDIPIEVFKLITLTTNILEDEKVVIRTSILNNQDGGREKEENVNPNVELKKQGSEAFNISSAQIKENYEQSHKSVRQRKSKSSFSQKFISNQSLSKVKVQPLAEEKKVRKRLLWQYGKTYLQHKRSNCINTDFQTKFQSLYKILTKQTKEGQLTNGNMKKIVTKLIQQQKQISQSQKEDLLKLFYEVGYRYRALKKTIGMMKKFSLTDQAEPEIQDQNSLLDLLFKSCYTSEQLLKSFTNFYFPRSYETEQQYQKNSQQKVKIFCAFDKKYWVQFLLQIINESNLEVEKKIMEKALQKVTEFYMENEKPEQPVRATEPKTPYYIIYQPKQNYQLSVKQLEQLYDSINWPFKIVVIILTDEYFQVCSKMSFHQISKTFEESTVKKSQESGQPRKYLSMPLEQVEWALKKKNTILLSTNRQFYGSHQWRSPNLSSTIWDPSKVFQFHRSAYKCLTLLQLITLINHEQKTFTDLQIQAVLKNSKGSKCSDKQSSEILSKQAITASKYQLLIKRSTKHLNQLQKTKVNWQFRKFIYQNSKNLACPPNEGFIGALIQCLFLPKLAISQAEYLSYHHLVQTLTFEQIKHLTMLPVLPNSRIENEKNSQCSELSQNSTFNLLASYMQKFKFLSSKLIKQLYPSHQNEKIDSKRSQRPSRSRSRQKKNSRMYMNSLAFENWQELKIRPSDKSDAFQTSGSFENKLSKIKQIQQSNRFYFILILLNKLYTYFRLQNNQYEISDFKMTPYQRSLKISLLGIIKQLVSNFQALLIWKTRKNKIYLENINTPICSYLLNSITPLQVVLATQPTQQPQITDAKQNYSCKSKSESNQSKISIRRTVKKYQGESLAEAIQMNQTQFCLNFERSRLQISETQYSKGNTGFGNSRSYFYEQSKINETDKLKELKRKCRNSENFQKENILHIKCWVVCKSKPYQYCVCESMGVTEVQIKDAHNLIWKD